MGLIDLFQEIVFVSSTKMRFLIFLSLTKKKSAREIKGAMH